MCICRCHQFLFLLQNPEVEYFILHDHGLHKHQKNSRCKNSLKAGAASKVKVNTGKGDLRKVAAIPSSPLIQELNPHVENTDSVMRIQETSLVDDPRDVINCHGAHRLASRGSCANRNKSVTFGGSDVIIERKPNFPAKTCDCCDEEPVWVLRDDLQTDMALRDDLQPVTPIRDNHDSRTLHRNGHTPGVRQGVTSDPASLSGEVNDLRDLVLGQTKLHMAEWWTIAKAVDRLLFLLSLVLTVFAYVIILVVIPSENEVNRQAVMGGRPVG